MKENPSRISLILIIVIVFPTLFFSGYELNTLSSNEAVVDSIYASQLKNLTVSVNQYSVDVLTRWADEFDDLSLIDKSGEEDSIFKLLSYHQAVRGVFYNDKRQVSRSFIDSAYQEIYSIDIQTLNHQLLKEDSVINKLEQYINNGYRKIQKLEINDEFASYYLYAIKTKDRQVKTAGLIIDKKAFVTEVLAPKLQSMAQSHFIISVLAGSEVIFSNHQDFTQAGNVRLAESLWLLDNYQIGVQILNDPVEQMIKKRTRSNIIMIIIMDVILLLGAFFIYRSLRQQLKLAQLKSEFISNVSHELKTPLALISMYSETLQMNRIPTEEKKMEYFGVINKEAQRLMRMVTKILNFSKMESGMRTFTFVETDLNDIVHRVIGTYKYHFKNAGFEYSVDYDYELPFISADEEAVADAISNLIDNGIKYSKETKKIEIKTGIRNDKVFVAVKDYGIGIKEKAQKHVFDKFYRVTDGNLALHAKGSGIGLNIVKTVITAHHGNVKLDSKFGEGSTFTLLFPEA